MTRRGTKTTTHVHRAHPPAGSGGGDKHDLMLHRHRLLRRTASFVLARKYRFNYPASRFEYAPVLPPLCRGPFFLFDTAGLCTKR